MPVDPWFFTGVASRSTSVLNSKVAPSVAPLPATLLIKLTWAVMLSAEIAKALKIMVLFIVG